MSQFTCDICQEGFEQQSRLTRHMESSHPQSAISAADIESVLSDIHFPKNRDELITYAKHQGEEDVERILRKLPYQKYRDAAEVARAFGELRSHQRKPSYQPSKRGGENALKSASAAKIAQTFKGIRFPVTGSDLKKYAVENTEDEAVTQIVSKFPDRKYNDMSDVAKEISRAG